MSNLAPPDNRQRIALMQEKLHAAFPDAQIHIEDESHLHIGHAGAKGGLGHFAVTMRSQDFAGMPLLAQHRAVYDALGEMMQTDIHALRLSTGLPQ